MPDRPATFETREQAEAFARSGFPEAARDRPLDYGFVQRPDGKWTWRADAEGFKRAPLGEDLVRADGLWPVFAALRCPVLVLRGGKSPAITDELSRRMEASNKRARVVLYPEAYHWVHDDEPESFISDVRAFLDTDC